MDALYACAFRAARRILFDDLAAEDVAEEAMLRAYVHWPQVSGHAEAWITRVASNLAISVWRRHRLGETHPQPARGRESDVADAVADRIDLARAIAGLSRRQREVVTLRYLVGLTEVETSEALGCSVPSVKRHASRALVHLRGTMPRPSLEVAIDA
jgi:RNA polymerase sigma factor (sigma-70 family)